MTDYSDVVDELRRMDAGDLLRVRLDGEEMWIAAQHASEYSSPEREPDGVWKGGIVDVLLRSPDWLIEERDLIYKDADLRMVSDEDEWPSGPEIRFAEEQYGDSVFDWEGEWRDVDVLHRIPQELWWERERAMEVVEELVERQVSVARVILGGCVEDYVAFHLDGGVWSRYESESREQSVSGFLEWLSSQEFQSVLGERGVELFPEFEGLFDVSQRTARDVLVALRYFRFERE